MPKIKMKTNYIDFLHKHSFYKLDKYLDKNTDLLHIPSENINEIVEEMGDLLLKIGIADNDEINEDGLIIEDIIDVLNVF